MGNDRKLQVSGTIDASPEQVFALLADPSRHTQLDGAGMLRGVDGDAQPVTGVGDWFVMNMNQDGLGDYRMRNDILAFEADRRIAWAPSIHPPGSLSHLLGDVDFSGYHYAWELEPLEGGRTTVTHTYDWSGVTDENALSFFPRVSREQLSGTLDLIAGAVR